MRSETFLRVGAGVVCAAVFLRAEYSPCAAEEVPPLPTVADFERAPDNAKEDVVQRWAGYAQSPGYYPPTLPQWTSILERIAKFPKTHPEFVSLGEVVFGEMRTWRPETLAFCRAILEDRTEKGQDNWTCAYQLMKHFNVRDPACLKMVLQSKAHIQDDPGLKIYLLEYLGKSFGSAPETKAVLAEYAKDADAQVRDKATRILNGTPDPPQGLDRPATVPEAIDDLSAFRRIAPLLGKENLTREEVGSIHGFQMRVSVRRTPS